MLYHCSVMSYTSHELDQNILDFSYDPVSILNGLLTLLNTGLKQNRRWDYRVYTLPGTIPHREVQLIEWTYCPYIELYRCSGEVDPAGEEFMYIFTCNITMQGLEMTMHMHLLIL